MFASGLGVSFFHIKKFPCSVEVPFQKLMLFLLELLFC